MPTRRLSRSTAAIFALTLLSRLTGFFRTMVLAVLFGTSMSADAWVMASALPNLLFGAANQAVTSTTVPIASKIQSDSSSNQYQSFINQVWTLLLLGSCTMVILGEVLAPIIISLLAPGFHGNERALTIRMTRIMIPSMIFWGASGFLSGILQSRENFYGMTLSPLVLNLVQILGIVLLSRWLGISGAAWGFTLAVASQLLLLIPLMRRQGFSPHFTHSFHHPQLRPMWQLMWPSMLVSSTSNIELITDRILASSMATGSISAMNFAYTMSMVPLGLVIAPLTTPIYTRLTRYYAERDRTRFGSMAIMGLRWILLIVVPVTLLLLVLNVPILRALYEHGRFTRSSLELTSHLLLCFLIALPAIAISTYLQQLYYARQDTKRPARYSLFAVMVNIIGNLTLTRYIGIYGLVLSSAIASWINVILLARTFHLRQHFETQSHFLTPLVLASGAMALALMGLSRLLHMNHLYGLPALISSTLMVTVLSLAVYISILWLSHVPEVLMVQRRLRKIAHKLVLL